MYPIAPTPPFVRQLLCSASYLVAAYSILSSALISNDWRHFTPLILLLLLRDTDRYTRICLTPCTLFLFDSPYIL